MGKTFVEAVCLYLYYDGVYVYLGLEDGVVAMGMDWRPQGT